MLSALEKALVQYDDGLGFIKRFLGLYYLTYNTRRYVSFHKYLNS